MKPLFGIETEYAVAATTQDGERFPQEALMAAFLDAARDRLPHLLAVEGGLFLQNGARLYVDCGCHPEYATPECTDPLDAVRHVRAGERIMLDVGAGVEESVEEIARVRVFKNNVDYSGSGATWGCHESYLHETLPELLPSQIVPHLVSRTIYTGAGGFNPLAKRLQFMLSPRAAHLEAVCSPNSTRHRPIYHTKNESLTAAKYNRMHLLCGESLCSEAAQYLKVGTTALVLALIGAGKRPGDEVRLVEPLRALRAVASDTTGSRSLAVAGQRSLTAIDIQFHYLEQVEQHLGEATMPAWGEEVCRRWRQTLERLTVDFSSLAQVLDWSVKHTLYAPRMGRSKAGSAAARRRELFEVDTRFAQLGKEGIFAALDESGVLEHRLTEADDDAAVTEAPGDSRARLRGAAVRRLAGRDDGSVCRWDQVFDGGAKRFLDLLDPFETEERWMKNSAMRSSLRRLLDSMASL